MKHAQGPVFIQSGGLMKNVFGSEDGKVEDRSKDGCPVDTVMMENFSLVGKGV